jgi:hypothetical protein
MWADIGRWFSETGIDIGGRMDDAARAVELVAQGFARATAYAFVGLLWYRCFRLGAGGVWLGTTLRRMRRVLERPAGLGKGYRRTDQKRGGNDCGVQARAFVSAHGVVPALPRTNLFSLPTGRRAGEFPLSDCRPAPGGSKMGLGLADMTGKMTGAQIGQSLERFEDRALLTGRGRYADDLPVAAGTLCIDQYVTMQLDEHTPVCLANAVADALGVADLALPLTPSRVAALLPSASP